MIIIIFLSKSTGLITTVDHREVLGQGSGMPGAIPHCAVRWHQTHIVQTLIPASLFLITLIIGSA